MSAWISNATPGQLPLDRAADAGQMRERGGAGQPQSHQATAARGDPDTVHGVVDAGQNPGRLGLQKLAGGREGNLSGGAAQKRGVQFRFQLTDRIRQRRLRHMQLRGGLPEVAGLGNDREIA
jgi:hypothetical protein